MENWKELGHTKEHKYPDDGMLEVQFSVIKNGVLKITWIGRNVIEYDNQNKQVHPTHWRYVL